MGAGDSGDVSVRLCHGAREAGRAYEFVEARQSGQEGRGRIGDAVGAVEGEHKLAGAAAEETLEVGRERGDRLAPRVGRPVNVVLGARLDGGDAGRDDALEEVAHGDAFGAGDQGVGDGARGEEGAKE